MSAFDQNFARAFGDALRQHLDTRGIDYAKAAPLLGVTKAALSTYWNDDASGKRKKPRAELLFRACKELEFAFEYNGYLISARTAKKSNDKPTVTPPEQLQLDYRRQFNLTEDDGQVSIHLRRLPGRVDFSVSLKAAS